MGGDFQRPERHIWSNCPSFFYWFLASGQEVAEMTCSCSDGNTLTDARFSNSSNQPQVIPLPDTHFFTSRGYPEIDRIAAEASDNWAERSDRIVWRGYPTGAGPLHMVEDLLAHPATNQRLRMAGMTKGSEIDFRFVRHPDRQDWNAVAEAFDMMAERLPPESWLGRKFAIDIDGFTNAWSNLMVRLKLGCCVLKVGSEFGYRQWYYDRLRPYEHYVPVKSDLSDLFEQVEWVRTHEAEAREIARAGQELARGITLESATREAVELVRAHWRE